MATAQLAIDDQTRTELKSLLQNSNARGMLSVATTWGIIFGSFALFHLFPNILTYLIGVTLIGGRQLALAILTHEGAHRSLFKTAWLNDSFVQWFCAKPVWTDLFLYRDHHLNHHRYTNTEKDPDISLTLPFPVSPGSLRRKFVRDLTGITTLRRSIAQIMMDFGYLTFTVAADPKPVDQSQKSPIEILISGIPLFGGFVLANALLAFVVVSAMGWATWSMWVVAYFTTYSLFIRVRSIAEHACTDPSSDQLLNTRHTDASWLARVTVAPHHVNYHLAHHMYMAVPHYNLPRVMSLLDQKGLVKQSPRAANYFEVLKIATTMNGQEASG